MNDISQKISEIVSDTMAAKQSELAALLAKLREDIDALQSAVSGFPGAPEQESTSRAPRAAAPTRRRRRTKAEPIAAVAEAKPAAARAPAKRKRREKTPEEREAISRRMTAYWQRRREEKAQAQG